MPKTYKAILSGDTLKWVGESPTSNAPYGQPVLVTLVDESELGNWRAEVLEQMAARGGVASIPDPDAWQREIRIDRPLPGRED
jgi:hypothetical protein